MNGETLKALESLVNSQGFGLLMLVLIVVAVVFIARALLARGNTDLRIASNHSDNDKTIRELLTQVTARVTILENERVLLIKDVGKLELKQQQTSDQLKDSELALSAEKIKTTNLELENTQLKSRVSQLEKEIALLQSAAPTIPTKVVVNTENVIVESLNAPTATS